MHYELIGFSVRPDNRGLDAVTQCETLSNWEVTAVLPTLYPKSEGSGLFG